MPSDRVLKTMNAVHRGLIKLSGGRVGWQAAMPVLELTTVGRKSGQPRTVLLTSPHQEGDDVFVVVASRGGDDKHPAWFLNLRDQPDVEVSFKGAPKRPMRARVANAEERAKLWPKIAGDFKNYAQYQTKTEREIPLVFLEPR
ncbi:nitroreductase/quinone reductase family protein [Amycolatopsis lexingtonensis]|uniref:nitroreductase/quinone reductase family protein n=1 Tax=Amycolatopsis lexingtonensis TaxID=218822 RepID=UPI003F7228ED